MGEKLKANLKKLLIVPALLVGIGALALAVTTRQAPERKPPQEASVAARVIAAPAVAVVPRALGYGVVSPGRVWDAVAEVGGRIVEIHTDLKKGAILPAGAVLLRVDPTDYQLAIARLEANVRAAEAGLAELGVREGNTRASLRIEERSLTLSGKDLDRKRALLKSKNVSQAAVDQEERNVLTRRQSVQAQRNLLNLIPAERQSLEAQLAVTRTQLDDARLDLERTTITVPFDARVAEVRVEKTQHAATGQVLAVLDAIDVSEVTAHLPIDKMMHVVARSEIRGLTPDTVMGGLKEVLGLEPVVRLYAGDFTVEWRGRVARISDTLDPQTRTVGVIVAVDDPYGQVQPGVRPPLAKNMYVEVELRGRPRPNTVVVPRAALHDGSLYVLDADSRLRIRPVEVDFRQAGFAVIRTGLEPGERVVVTDLVPAIEGMLVTPHEDGETLRALVSEAEGEGWVK